MTLCLLGHFSSVPTPEVVTVDDKACTDLPNPNQDLVEAFDHNKKALGRLQIRDGIGDRQRRELDILIDRFSCPAPIRPLDMFDLNHASWLGLNNTVLTYLVILLQFKGLPV